MRDIEKAIALAVIACLVLWQCNGGNGGDDAVCGNGTCESGEDSTTCPADCPAAVCGNGVCEAGETAESCAADCTGEWVCGDGVCEGPETETTCPADCSSGPVCGNGICETGETMDTCIQDCPCAPGCDESGNVIMCGSGGEIRHVDCPDDYMSACYEVSAELGYWCSCGSVPAAGICHSIPDLSIDAVACGDGGYLLILDCYEDLGSSCITVGEGIGCSCGSVTENGLCHHDSITDQEYLLGCVDGHLTYGVCPQGSACGVHEGVSACYCDNASDSYCPPENGCPSDPDCDIPAEHLEVVKPAGIFLYGGLLRAIWMAKREWPDAYDCPGISGSGVMLDFLINCEMEGLGGLEVTGTKGYLDGYYFGFRSVKVADGPVLNGELGTYSAEFSDPSFSVDLSAAAPFPNGLKVTYTDIEYDVYFNVDVVIDTKGTTSDCTDDVYAISGENTGVHEGTYEYEISTTDVTMSASHKLPNAGTITVTKKIFLEDTVFYTATVTFDSSTPSTCQVQVTIDSVTRAVTIPGICS